MKDAAQILYEHRFSAISYQKPDYEIDVIDLDPYGTAVPFIDSSI